jgi:hypothetical protein
MQHSDATLDRNVDVRDFGLVLLQVVTGRELGKANDAKRKQLIDLLKGGERDQDKLLKEVAVTGE